MYGFFNLLLRTVPSSSSNIPGARSLNSSVLLGSRRFHVKVVGNNPITRVQAYGYILVGNTEDFSLNKLRCLFKEKSERT